MLGGSRHLTPGGEIELVAGAKFTLTNRDVPGDEKEVGLTYPDLPHNVRSGDTILLADGVYTGDGNRDVEVWGKQVIIRSQSDDPTACIIDCQATPDDMHFGFQLYGDG